MESTKVKVRDWVVRQRRGRIFFSSELQRFGSSGAVRIALWRLCSEGRIVRLAYGIFVYPKFGRLRGVYVIPSTEEIVSAIAKSEKIRAIPTGQYALYALGLSSRAPRRMVFLTDGAPRYIRLQGGEVVVFSRVNPKYLLFKSEIVTLVIFALKAIGKGRASADELLRLREALSYEEPELVRHDAALTSPWISDMLLSLVEDE